MQNTQKQYKVTDDIIARLDKRFVNWLIDIIMQTLIFVVAFSFIASVSVSYGNKEFPDYLINNKIGQFTFVSIIRLSYYIILETLFARTIGKFVSQTIVVDENGERPSHSVILIRSLCRLIPFYEVSFFGIPTRGWHDSISKTYVVDKWQLEQGKRNFNSLKGHDYN